MTAAVRQQLLDATQDVQMKEVITFLYRDHPQGAAFDGLKDQLFLHDAFEEARLTRLVEDKLLAFDGKRYTLAAAVRQLLDRDPVILMDEFLR